jgi:hypothetical protein
MALKGADLVVDAPLGAGSQQTGHHELLVDVQPAAAVGQDAHDFPLLSRSLPHPLRVAMDDEVNGMSAETPDSSAVLPTTGRDNGQCVTTRESTLLAGSQHEYQALVVADLSPSFSCLLAGSAQGKLLAD